MIPFLYDSLIITLSLFAIASILQKQKNMSERLNDVIKRKETIEKIIQSCHYEF